MRQRWLSVVALLLLWIGAARADDDHTSYRAVIDRVDLEPSSLGGQRLRVYLSALVIQGSLLDLTDPKSIKLLLNNSEKQWPYSLGVYSGTASDTAVVFVIQTTADYAAVLPVIAETIDTNVLGPLGEHAQIAILPYGDAVGTGKLGSVKVARQKLTQLASDGSATDGALLETVERALGLLKRAHTEPEGRPLRKMIVVIGDGRDRNGDRDRVTRLGKRAAKELVRIHSLGYTPTDLRRPLLLMGELSKQSLGTFRWIRAGKVDSWTPATQQLGDEIGKQYVITYFPSADDDVAEKRLRIVTAGRTVVSSNELKVPAPTCGGEACEVGYCAADKCVVPAPPTGRGIVGWIVIIGGIAVAALVALGVVGYFLTKKQGVPKAPKAPKAPKPKLASAAPAPVVAPAAPVPAGGPVLFILSGPRAGERIPLHHGFMIGKAPTSHLVIDDGFASTNHAQIGMDSFRNCRLFDQNSTNGTLVNGVRVTEYALQHGVTIQIGSTQLRFLAE